MRKTQIPGFPGRRINITELESLTKGRLQQDIVIWPDQAVPLVGYMVWPNDEETRNRWIDAHQRDDKSAITTFEHAFKLIQQHWARVADIVHLHFDLRRADISKHALARASERQLR